MSDKVIAERTQLGFAKDVGQEEGQAAYDLFVRSVSSASLKFLGETGVNPGQAGEILLHLAYSTAQGVRGVEEFVSSLPGGYGDGPRYKHWGSNRPEFIIRAVKFLRDLTRSVNGKTAAAESEEYGGSKQIAKLLDMMRDAVPVAPSVSERVKNILGALGSNIESVGIIERATPGEALAELARLREAGFPAIAVDLKSGLITGIEELEEPDCKEPDCKLHAPGGFLAKLKAHNEKVLAGSATADDGQALLKQIDLDMLEFPTDPMKVN